MLAVKEREASNSNTTSAVDDGIYAQHLSAVNTEKAVTASEDIYDDNGTLLIKKGINIQEQVVDRIVKFKLLKPLDQSIDIEDQISGDDIQAFFSGLVNQFPDIKSMYAVVDNKKLWQACCQRFNQHAILRQKLTVYRLQMPEHFSGTVFCAWVGMSIAHRMKLSQEDIYAAFLGGLVRDIGMLHIDPNIIKNGACQSPDQWRAIQSHVVIAKEIIERCEGMPKGLAQAVLEHHERSDGSGYPFHKQGNAINTIAQIIGIADTVCCVYNKLMAPEGRGLRDIIPVLQLNANRLLLPVYSSLMLWLQECELNEKCMVDARKIPQLVKDLLKKNALLSDWLKEIVHIADTFPEDKKDKYVNSILNCSERFVHMLRGAGILDDGYIRWLEQVVEEKLEFAYREVEDYYLMLKEIHWQLSHLSHELESLAQADFISGEARQHLHQGLEGIKRIEAQLPD